MRILIIEPGLKLWGSERAFVATVPALLESHDRVIVMAPGDSELAEELIRRGVCVETAPIGLLHKRGKLARFTAALRIIRACRRHRIDQIYLNQAGLCRVVHVVAKLLRLPLVIHVRLLDDIERCARLEASAAAPVVLVFVSHDLRRRYPEDRTANQHKRLAVAYDPFELVAGPETPTVSRSRMLACVGRIAKIKGQRQLIEAVALARKGGLQADLDVIGAGVPEDLYAADVERLANNRFLSGAVRFLGYRHDVEVLLPSYQFVVVPSLYEPLGRVVMEAWQAGAVPICSRQSGGAAEIVAACGGGLLYDGHTPESICEALQRAATLSEKDRIAKVEQGRAWVRSSLSIAAYQKALAGILFPKGNALT